jgi:hypothetical protein
LSAPEPPRETGDRREAVRLYTKASLKRLGWTFVLLVVAECVFVVAYLAGLPQGPTVGCILLALIAGAFILGRVYESGLTRRNGNGDKSAESGGSPGLQKRD